MGYSSNIKHRDYNFSTVSSEIKQSRPVILNGKQDSFLGFIPYNGHAWICDGYSYFYEKRRRACVVINGALPPVEVRYIPLGWDYEYTSSSLHMNWGWGGNYDGWFSPHNFTIKKDKETINFKYGQGMITGIYPNK